MCLKKKKQESIKLFSSLCKVDLTVSRWFGCITNCHLAVSLRLSCFDVSTRSLGSFLGLIIFKLYRPFGYEVFHFPEYFVLCIPGELPSSLQKKQLCIYICQKKAKCKRWWIVRQSSVVLLSSFVFGWFCYSGYLISCVVDVQIADYKGDNALYQVWIHAVRNTAAHKVSCHTLLTDMYVVNNGWDAFMSSVLTEY